MAYIRTKIKRGFTEIADLFAICQEHRAVICGGYARYCLSPRPTVKVVLPDDLDMFPSEESDMAALLERLKGMGFEIQHENHVCYALVLPKGATDEQKDDYGHWPKLQIIKPVREGAILTVGTVEEILDNFDFTVVRAALLSATEGLVDEDFLSHEKTKILALRNIHCPVSSMLRCCKYARKGYFMRPAEAIKLFVDWEQRPPEYRERLLELFSKSSRLGGQSEDNPDGITQEEIDELEALFRID